MFCNNLMCIQCTFNVYSMYIQYTFNVYSMFHNILVIWLNHSLLLSYPKVIFVPKSNFCEKFGWKWPINWFLKGWAEYAPPAIRDAFQMLLHVGLKYAAVVSFLGSHALFPSNFRCDSISRIWGWESVSSQ